MHGLLRCNINTGVHARARGESKHVTLRCHNSPRWETGLALEVRRGFWRFWKSQLVELRLDIGREGSTFACSPKPGQWPLWRVPHVLGGRWKSQNRKNVYLSPYVKEPLNSKVIKSFVPELRSRKCFSNFEIPMFYLYGHSMYVSHIAISWLWYTTTLGQSGPGSDGNKDVLCILQSSSITGTSPSDCFVSYPGHSLVGGLTPLERCSWCILQPQPTGQSK